MSKRSYARRRVHALGGADTPTHRPGAENRPVDEPFIGSNKSVSTFQLQHSKVTVEQTPVGYVARIERDNDVRRNVEYAGPHDRATLLALSEVSQ